MKMTNCQCGKRGFHSEHDAERALGRTRAKRQRKHDARGTRRGMEVERRYYECDWVEGIFHLTHTNGRRAVVA